MTDLKPCPFCGGRAEWQTDTGPMDEGYWEYIECQNCGAKHEVDKWNTRVGDK